MIKFVEALASVVAIALMVAVNIVMLFLPLIGFFCLLNWLLG